MARDGRSGLVCAAVTGAMLLGLTACAAQPSSAQTMSSAELAAVAPDETTLERALRRGVQVVRIRDHKGGYLPRVVAQVNTLNRAGVAGRIDGGYCFSACTVFLALRDVCVAPWTQFGFHAPSDPRTRQALSGQAWQQVTAHVAGYYRPELADWWMRHGRHVRTGMAFRTGADLISMGYRACPPLERAQTG